MQHDLFGSLRDIDLGSNFAFDLLRSTYTLLKASTGETDDDAIVDSWSLLVQKFLFVEEYFARNNYFDNTWPMEV